jgi:hypothetical protein
VELHLGTEERFACFCGEVRWTAPSGRAPAVGVRFDAGDQETWAGLLADLRDAGAPPA